MRQEKTEVTKARV